MFLSETSKALLDDFPIRKSKAQKESFRLWLTKKLNDMGYEPRVETVGLIEKSDNVVVGNPDKASVLLTAHYDTCAVLPFPNFAAPKNIVFSVLHKLMMFAVFFVLGFGISSLIKALWKDAPFLFIFFVLSAVFGLIMFLMLRGKANKHNVNDNTSGVITLLETASALPEEFRDKVCFVFFDNEEKGLLGSRAFARKHFDVKKNTLVLNFDCVSDGDYLELFPAKALRKDGIALEKLRQSFVGSGQKKCEVYDGKSFYSSDQLPFKCGVGICALNQGRHIGLCLNKIHTGKDTVMQEENIFVLRDGALKYLSENL